MELKSGCIPCPREKGEESGNREGLYSLFQGGRGGCIPFTSEKEESKLERRRLYSIQGRKENYFREEAAFSVPGRKESELEISSIPCPREKGEWNY